jgi:hypothetical protein
MGMFDKEQALTKTDLAADEQGFFLWKGEYIGISKHAEYGENQKARVDASPLSDKSDIKPYVVFGVLADQIQRMGADDLPAVVRIGKDGRANVFEFVRQLSEDEKIPF